MFNRTYRRVVSNPVETRSLRTISHIIVPPSDTLYLPVRTLKVLSYLCHRINNS